jgi:hypothetical protein
MSSNIYNNLVDLSDDEISSDNSCNNEYLYEVLKRCRTHGSSLNKCDSGFCPDEEYTIRSLINLKNTSDESCISLVVSSQNTDDHHDGHDGYTKILSKKKKERKMKGKKNY